MRPHALAYPLASSRMSDYLQLTKPRLNLLVVFTTGVGYWLGVAGHVDSLVLFHTVVGTALVAGGSAVINQLYEQDVDALMARTRLRPLPDGRMTPWRAFVFGMLLSALGLAQLSLRRQSPERGRGLRHAGQLRRLVHADEAPLVAGHRRRRHPGRPAAGDRLGGGDQHARPRGVAAVRDRVPVADAALPGAGLAVPRGVRACRLPGAARRGTHRHAARRGRR